MKKLFLIFLSLACSCISPQMHVLSKYKKESFDNASLAVFFEPNSITFYFDRPMLSTKGVTSPTGVKFDSTASPEENFRELFVHYAADKISKLSRIQTLVLSSKIDSTSGKTVTEWGDTVRVPSGQNFIRDYSEIDYALIFEKFDIIYTDCGMMYTTISGKCVPELQMIITFKIVSNKGDGLIQYGTIKEYFEYVKPKTGMFSKPDPDFLNVRYSEWETLIKFVLMHIFRSGPFSK